MQAITRLNANDPVVWNDMNNKFGEIEGRDNKLQQQINVLKEHGFWSNAKLASGSAYDLQHGEWFGTLTNSPESYTCFYKVYVGDNANYKYIECHSWVTSNSYRNKCIGGAWQFWEKIPTTTKTSFSCTAKVGYAIVSQNCYTLNGMAYINVAIKKTDGTVFEAQQHALFTTPYYSASFPYPITAVFTNGPLVGGFAYNGAVWTEGGCYITLTSNTPTQITIHAEVPL